MDAFLTIASSESVWREFEADVIQPAVDDLKSLVELLRKRFCLHYSAKINRKARKYFRALDQVQSEPVDIHSQFMKLVQLLLEANEL